MNTLVIFSAVCIGLAAGGANHATHSVKDQIASGTQTRELVDVPYTVEYRNNGGGSYQSSGQNSFGRSYQQQQPSYHQNIGGNSYGRSYQQQPQPQFDIQRAELTHQNSYSYSQPQTQSRQYVDVPYTVEVRNTGSSPRSYSRPQVQTAPVVQQRSYVQPQQQIVEVPYTPAVVQQRTYSPPQQTTRTQSQQLVDVPYTVEIKRAPAPVVQQRSYSPPVQSVRRQPKQLVDIPYTVETTGNSNSNVDSGYRFVPYSLGNNLQVQAPQQRSSGAQYVDIPYQVIGGGAASTTGATNNFRFLPYSLGNSLPISNLGGGFSSGYATSVLPSAIY